MLHISQLIYKEDTTGRHPFGYQPIVYIFIASALYLTRKQT